jgi:malate dehydrogenase (oxaloacetate-decarboxylating)(NADP+)
MQEALKILKENYPGFIVDGEMQANFAVNPDLLAQNFEFSNLVKQNVNTLIFPNLASGNIAYKLIQEFGAAEAVGPILLGTKKPVHVLQLDCSIREVVNMATIAVIDAQISSN